MPPLMACDLSCRSGFASLPKSMVKLSSTEMVYICRQAERDRTSALPEQRAAEHESCAHYALPLAEVLRMLATTPPQACEDD